MQDHCLNCNHKTAGKFCSNCGQKTDTHRIRLGHFIMHDMLHGVWHLEKGILFTLKETFTRPGKAALDYISGKRIRYYNVFYLSLLLIGLSILLSHFLNYMHPEINETDKDSAVILQFFEKYVKLIVLATVPILALTALVVFRRMRLNLAEHLIIGGFNLIGMIIINLLVLLANFANLYDVPAIFGYLEVGFFFCMVLFPMWGYWNLTKGTYRFGGFLWRIILFYLLLFIEIFVLLLLIIVLLTGKTELYLNI